MRFFLICLIVVAVSVPSSSAVKSKSDKPAASFEAQVESIRQLDYKKKVQYASMNQDELLAFLNKKIDEELPPEKLEDEFAAFKILGLGEEINDIRQVMVDLFIEQVAAFYDQKTRQLVTRDEPGFIDNFNDVILVHELTHALQDQYYGLDKLIEQVKDNSDMQMALMSLVEGDASLVQTRYMYTQKKWKVKDILSMLTYNQEKLFSAPYFLRENLMFPYTKGVNFATYLFDIGGWSCLDRAYGDPPRSTEQIIHPEKYVPNRDDPRVVTIPDLRQVLGKDWSLKSQDNLGELNTYILLRKYIGGIWAKKPSRGWGGDWYNYYRQTDSDQWALVWDTVWDSAKDADEFFDAYRKLIERRFKQRKAAIRRQDARSKLWVYDSVVVYVAKLDQEVLVMHFQSMKFLEKAITKFTGFELPKSSSNKSKEVSK